MHRCVPDGFCAGSAALPWQELAVERTQDGPAPDQAEKPVRTQPQAELAQEPEMRQAVQVQVPALAVPELQESSYVRKGNSGA